MSFVCKLLMLVLFQMSVLAHDSIKQELKMAYLIDGLNHIQYKDTRIAFDLLFEDMSEYHNLKVAILYYKKEEKVLLDYTKNKFDNMTINAYFYLNNMDTMDKINKTCWVIKQDEEDYEQYVLLTRNPNIKTLKDLEGKKVAIAADNYLGKMFLEKEIITHLGQDAKKFSYKLVKFQRNSTVILKTFFGKVDASLVPLYALNLVSELNPAVKKTLNEIMISERVFAPVLAFSHQNANDEYVDIYANHIKNLSNSVRGQNILDLFQIKGVKEIECNELAPMKEYFKSYKRLQRSIK